LKYTTLALSAVLTMLVVSEAAFAQGAQPARPPGTDIFVVEFKDRHGTLNFGKPVNITRRPGYDNQPAFLPGGFSLLYTSIREDGQADIYLYNLNEKDSVRITKTTESEYSPTLTPDRKHISVIRVEADSTQRLWQFPYGKGSPSVILDKIKPVGYHVWVDEKRLVLFILGSPNTLQLVDVATQKTEIIASNIGRSLHRIPDQRKVSFVHKVSADEWIIKSLDPDSLKTETIIKTLPGSEDYAWTGRGDLISAKGSKLFKFAPGKDKDWQEVADFSGEGITAITRLAVSPNSNRLALVVSEK